MKRTNIILIALFLLLSVGQAWAQRDRATLSYKPAAMFDGDTLRYLEYNYTIRQTQYVGRTVSEILKELEYPVLYIVEATSQRTHVDGFSKSQLVSLSLGIQQTTRKGPNPLKDCYIMVTFENPPALNEYWEASGATRDNPCPVFSSKLYDFIKDRKITHICANPYIFKDPELQKEAKQREEKIRREGAEGAKKWERMRRERDWTNE